MGVCGVCGACSEQPPKTQDEKRRENRMNGNSVKLVLSNKITVFYGLYVYTSLYLYRI